MSLSRGSHCSVTCPPGAIPVCLRPEGAVALCLVSEGAMGSCPEPVFIPAHPGPKVVTAKWLPSKGFVAVCSGLTMPPQCPSPGCHGHVLVLRVPWGCILVLRVPWLRVPVLQGSLLCRTPAGVTPGCPSPECIVTARPGPEPVQVLCPDPEGATAVRPGAEGVVSLCHSPAGISVPVSGS